MKFLALSLCLVSSALWAQSTLPFPPERELRPFATDGCTLAPDGTINRPRLFRECCVAHDLRFWGGGTSSERNKADRGLRSCIRKKAGPGYAAIYYNAVRAGRLSPWTIPSKRWGNAWFEMDGVRKLSVEEIQRLMGITRTLELDPEIREAYLLELEARIAKLTSDSLVQPTDVAPR